MMILHLKNVERVKLPKKKHQTNTEEFACRKNTMNASSIDTDRYAFYYQETDWSGFCSTGAVRLPLAPTDVLLVLRFHVTTTVSVSEWVGCLTQAAILIMLLLQVNHL